MMKKKNVFSKTNISNRFIAVKYTGIPKETDSSCIINPFIDGLGFVLNLKSFSRIGASEKDIEYILKNLKKINKIISEEYCLFKKKEIPNHFSDKFNDKFILGSILASFFLLFAMEALKSINRGDLLFIIIIGFLFVLIGVYFYLFSAFCIKIKKNRRVFSDILPKHVEPVLAVMRIYLKAKNFSLEYDNKYFWIKISKII